MAGNVLEPKEGGVNVTNGGIGTNRTGTDRGRRDGAGRAIAPAALVLAIATFPFLASPTPLPGTDGHPLRPADDTATAAASTTVAATATLSRTLTPTRTRVPTVTPDVTAAPRLRGVIQSPISLDVAPDGRVYLSDPGPGVVQVMWPWGEFAAPIGLAGPEEGRLEVPGHLAVGHDPASGRHRLYVLDPEAKYLKVYDLDGRFVARWPTRLKGSGIAVAPDGRVFVADRTTYTVRVFTPAGVELFAFGEEGDEKGQFKSFTDLSISPAGDVLAVGDQKGRRVQLFRLPADPASDDIRLRRVFDLTQGVYESGQFTCRAPVVNALGGDDVWIGEGDGACLLSAAQTPRYPIASVTLDGVICKRTVRLPRIRKPTGQFYALASYDTNRGECGGRETVRPAAPVILRYLDFELKRVHTMWPVPGSAYFAKPKEDAMVADSTPGANYGGDDELQVRRATEQTIHSFLKFEVEGLPTVVGQRRGARLHLFANGASDDAGALYGAPNDYPTTTPDTTPTPWRENNLTWLSAPPVVGTPMYVAGKVNTNQWVAFDLPTTVAAEDGTYSFAIQSASDDRVDYNSSEADDFPPVLVVDMAIAAVPSPANVTPPTPTPSPPPTDQPSPTQPPSPSPTLAPTSETPSPTFTVSPTPSATPSPTFEPGRALVFTPIHDTRVQSSAPDKSYGTATNLRVRTGITTTVYHSYVKFEVAGITDPSQIATATLRLYAYDGGPDLAVHRVSNDDVGGEPWTERTLTWDSAPPLSGLPLATAAPVAEEAWTEVDVTAAITGDGTYSFGLATSGENSIYFNSKESEASGPELLVRFSGTLPTATPSATPEATPTPFQLYVPRVDRSARIPGRARAAWRVIPAP